MENLISFVMAHQAFIAGITVALIDLAFAINPSLKSNGILHSIVTFAQSKETPPTPPTTPVV